MSDKKAMNVWEKHTAIVTQLKAPKDQKNQFGGYMYRKAEDIYQAVKPLLTKYNVALIAPVTVDFVGNNLYETCTAVLIDCDNPSDRIEVKHSARESISRKGMDEPQLSGSASTYATKYALMHLFCIDDTKEEVYAPDPDTQRPPTMSQSLMPSAYQAPQAYVPTCRYNDIEELKIDLMSATSRDALVEIYKAGKPLSERKEIAEMFAKKAQELSRTINNNTK